LAYITAHKDRAKPSRIGVQSSFEQMCGDRVNTDIPQVNVFNCMFNH